MPQEIIFAAAGAVGFAILAYLKRSYSVALVTAAARRLKQSSAPVSEALTDPLIPSEDRIAENTREVAENTGQTAENTREVAEGLSELVAELTNVNRQGFEWLTEEQFDEERIHPENCWRRRFEFAEIAAGYPIDRRDRNGESLTEVLMSDLEDGGAAVVLDAPGAGKTTVCRSVLVEWTQEGGAVLYRDRNEPEFSDTGPVRKDIKEASEENPVLVYVADAVRSANVRVMALAYEFRHDERVSFLLDSRQTEWKRFKNRGDEQDIIDLDSDDTERVLESIQHRSVPELTEDDVERVVERFEEKTDEKVMTDPATMHERVSVGGEASAMLLLSYYLPVGGIEVSGEDDDSALTKHVQKVYDLVAPDVSGTPERDAELRQQAALCINVLNAAGLDVRLDSVYPLARDDDEERDLRGWFNDEFDGRLVFDRENDDDLYWSNHEVWSMLYLDLHLSDNHTETARGLFEQCVNAIFEARAGDPEALEAAVESVFYIGRRRPKLAPLFGRTDGSRGAEDRDVSGIRLPDGSSAALEAQCARWRGHMCLNTGKYTAASAEYESYRELAEKSEIDSTVMEINDIHNYLQLDTIRGQSDYDEKFEQWCRYGGEEPNWGGKQSLANYGASLGIEGEYEKAEEVLQKSLDMSGDILKRGAEATALNNLGLVAYENDKYEDATEYILRSIKINDEIGNRAGKAKGWNNLGLLAEKNNLGILSENYDVHDDEVARGSFLLAAQIHAELGAFRNCLQSFRGVTRTEIKLGNLESASNIIELALEAIEESDRSDLESERRWYEDLRDDIAARQS
jgi:tetratricopeptide (TPR) repeat protein